MVERSLLHSSRLTLGMLIVCMCCTGLHWLFPSHERSLAAHSLSSRPAEAACAHLDDHSGEDCHAVLYEMQPHWGAVLFSSLLARRTHLEPTNSPAPHTPPPRA